MKETVAYSVNNETNVKIQLIYQTSDYIRVDYGNKLIIYSEMKIKFRRIVNLNFRNNENRNLSSSISAKRLS